MDNASTIPAAIPAPFDEPVAAIRRRRQVEATWVRPALLGLLASSAVLYLWNLAASGWANAYYYAAVQAGTKSWKAFFFGSLDASNFITIDKTPASLWVMEISARIFGLNSWSVLAPQALEGVATVFVVYLAVRRWFGPVAGLLAGAVVALTPVAALTFRFNNPDALLVLLLTFAVYATLRAVESGKTGWLVLAGGSLGFGFLTKELAAFIIVPVLGAVYLFAGPPALARRSWQLAIAAGTLLVSAGWWVAIVELWPASDRPYIGGSQNNSLLNVILGYNGLGRLTGNETGSVGGLAGIGGRWGLTGWNRLFNNDFGGEASWLIPAALILGVVPLVMLWRRPRRDIQRAAFLAWGGCLLLTAAVFSFSLGIIHPYYTVALAPAIGALVGMGAGFLWERRSETSARVALSAAVVVSAVWSYMLLSRSPEFVPMLRVGVLLVGLGCAVFIVGLDALSRWASAGTMTAALAASLAGPAAFTYYTASQPHTGAIPSAGPPVTVGRNSGFPGGGPGAGFPGGVPGGLGPNFGGGGPGGIRGGFPGGRFGGGGGGN